MTVKTPQTPDSTPTITWLGDDTASPPAENASEPPQTRGGRPPTADAETAQADAENGPAEARPAKAENEPAKTEAEPNKAEDEPVEAEDEPEAIEDEGEPAKAKGRPVRIKDRPSKAEDESEAAQDEPVKVKGGPGPIKGAGKSSGKVRGRSLRPGGQVMLTTVMLLALVASIVTAVVQWQRAGTLADEEAARKEVRTRAAEFGVALLSYDHKNLKAARDKVMSMASDDFAKTYDVAFTGGLEGVIGKLEADATASVRAVYLNDMDAATAKAVVVLDSEVHSTAGTRRVLGSYLEMELVRQKGQWKVTDVSSIGAINESMTGSKDGQSAAPAPSPSQRS